MKRLFDVIVSLSVLVAFSPILLLVALLVRTKLGSPIFFTQIRPGLHGKPFKMVKFRTLTEQKDESGHYLPDADRLTSFGALLRSTSLDELPELWNVLKGDMSLVGPRPLLMEYLPLYTPEQYRRHEVRPGVTGWAQINGRNAIDWETRFQLDVYYVDHQSFWFDMKIIVLTAAKVLKREGIQQEGQATVTKFTGSGKN
ncbi:sugar transferase [Limnobacter sp. MED105]|jgi:sugar transferase EpsL|uniref:sugar transferase n=1 Tax=Limnobacter sp. MED105 TaxID=391597 RepID=UPI000156C3C3|nr:sugar transferase [Limnobacter sp. MED105]EDM85006.1 probable glycosyl transferase transmembrane protein [Limnobacter sp. MED105]